MKTVRTEALLIPICDAQQQESQDEEIRNEVKSAFSKDATSEMQDTAPTASSMFPNRKGEWWTINYQAEMLCLEDRKLELFIQQGGNNEDDLNFFPYVKQLPSTHTHTHKSYF